MRVTVKGNKIIIENAENFEAKHILECGQVFRYVKNGEGDYTVFSKDRKARIVGADGDFIIDCFNKTDAPYFYNYFDLDTDYGKIRDKILLTASENAFESEFINKVLGEGKGIRILKQDRIETILSFIISANNNIKRIQGIIERLCVAAGEDMGGYYAFPSVPALAKLTKKFYNDIGAGYRDDYLYQTVKSLNEGFDLDAVDRAETPDAEKLIAGLMGVGPKVANCILLFGFAKTDTFPVDTWINKTFNGFYGGNLNRREIQSRFIKRYGKLSGYVQQYIFYAAREGVLKI